MLGLVALVAGVRLAHRMDRGTTRAGTDLCPGGVRFRHAVLRESPNPARPWPPPARSRPPAGTPTAPSPTGQAADAPAAHPGTQPPTGLPGHQALGVRAGFAVGP